MRLSPDVHTQGSGADVLIRGIGIFTPAGSTLDQICDSALQIHGQPSHVPWLRIARVDVERTAELLPNRKVRRMLSRGVHLGLVAAVTALADAGLSEYPCTSDRLGVFGSGFICVEDIVHVHSLLKHLRDSGQSWREEFGKPATERLPPFVLLRCLPNAAFCHAAQYAAAKSYNATLFTGPGSGIDCLRQAARAIKAGRLDAALVVVCDSPLSWEITSAMARLTESQGSADVLTIGEAGCALYLERAGLHPGRSRRAYARYLGSSACQSRDGITHFRDDAAFAPPRGLGEAVAAATSGCLRALEQAKVRYLDLGGSGVPWWDESERVAARQVAEAELICTSARTGYLANCSGAVGLAQICHLLAKQNEPAAGLVVRAALTGQCTAALLQTASS